MIIVKIVFTLLFLMMLIFAASGSMMTLDEKREEFWGRTTVILGALFALIIVGLILAMHWMY